MLIEFAPLLSALLLWAAFPPLDFGFLAFIAPAPLLVALRRAPTRRGSTLLGFVFGLAFFGLLIWWVKWTSYLSLLVLGTTLALFFAVYGGLLWGARRWSPGLWWVAAVGGWALMEYVRGRFPVGGFTWGMLGYPAGEYAPLRSAARYIGTSGWSVVAIGVAAGLSVVGGERGRSPRWLIGPVAALGFLIVLGAANGPVETENPVRVAVVQGNSPCPPGPGGCPDAVLLIYESHLRLTRTLEPGTVDLVIWSESSTGSSVEPVTNPERAAEIGAEARRLGAYLLVGATRSLGPTSFKNVNLLFAPDGSIVGEYTKQHPVPFGEYVPLRSVFGRLIGQLDQVPKDIVRGSGSEVFVLPEGVLGTLISFEGAFPELSRASVLDGARLLVVATNTSSYGPTPASDQFIAMTRMRAAELGVDLVHAAITGRSAFIDAGGKVLSETDLYVPVVLTGRVGFRVAGPTLYARLGDWLQYVAIMALLLAIAYRYSGWSRHRQEEADWVQDLA